VVLNMRMVLCVLCSGPAYYGLLFMPSSHALGNTPTFGNVPPPDPRSRPSDQPPESAFHPETGRLGGCHSSVRLLACLSPPPSGGRSSVCFAEAHPFPLPSRSTSD
jgi:hypothetical protein